MQKTWTKRTGELRIICQPGPFLLHQQIKKVNTLIEMRKKKVWENTVSIIICSCVPTRAVDYTHVLMKQWTCISSSGCSMIIS